MSHQLTLDRFVPDIPDDDHSAELLVLASSVPELLDGLDDETANRVWGLWAHWGLG